MKIKKRELSGSPNPGICSYETENREIARKAAAEGMVLLKNENNLLPLDKKKKVALYGAGAAVTIKGGMGSGDVNARETINVYQGLKDAGYEITTEEWIAEYLDIYKEERLRWRQKIWDKEDSDKEERLRLFRAYSSTPFEIPAGSLPVKTDTDTAIYVLSRNAGEGKDRLKAEGDYLLTEEESTMIKQICELYPHVLLVLNIGGIVDLGFTDEYPQMEAILYMQQPGMEGGHALADVVSGKIPPSGKLTDTWAFHYEDYPNAGTFSYNDKDVEHELYQEGIYVGYRYFDTYDKAVRYGFGYGLSYTTFQLDLQTIKTAKLGTKEAELCVSVSVKNTGDYSGKEVVQVYACPPQGQLAKEYRRLVGFEKTGLLQPGEEETLTISIPVDLLGSYQEESGEWYIEEGCYGIFAGNSLADSVLVATVEAAEDILLSKSEAVCKLQRPLQELEGCTQASEDKRTLWKAKSADKPVVQICQKDVKTEIFTYQPGYEDIPEKVRDFVDSLTEDQLILLATGDISKAQGSAIGAAGVNVPGSAAETYSIQEKEIPGIVLADGPAGLRLSQTYQVKDGKILPSPSGKAIENGFLCREEAEEEGETYYQYCTAFPVGTLLAQSWDRKLLEECGRAVQRELEEFGVTLWLAPGMNIHRNPLCGRNFEYYSEDPVLSGYMAAAMTRGVQWKKGYGTTIKHFACNNQEDNRMGSDSIVGERALREIYLRGFEISVKESHPLSIMTSYNLVNGVHAANSYDLCTKIARNEWGYEGVIMTDWTTTMNGADCTASGCMRAGNDLIMPGSTIDHENMREELQAGTLDIKDVKRSVARLIQIVWQSDRYEE